MNLPNKLTIIRIILVPVFLVFYLIPFSKWNFLIATVVFIVASLTDWLDGAIARKRNLVTNFGKFADPLADKLLVCSAFIAFVSLEQMPAWICIIIIARELAIEGFRLICVEQGIVVAASVWGKVKTWAHIVFIVMTSLNVSYYLGDIIPGVCDIFEIARIVVMYIALVLTIISFVDYIYKNRQVLKA